jgi:hypothetical protein
MNDWGYVVAGWGVVVGGLALYAGSILVRGRRLAGRVPPERRRWMATPTDPGQP